MNSRCASIRPVAGLVVALVLLDQITKEWVRLRFALGESWVIIPRFFNLTYIRNPGAAWGLFGTQTGLLTLISIVLLALLLIFRRHFLTDSRLHRLALACLVAGILGNLLDRLRFGYVVDFLDFYVGRSHWPAFNVADAAICIGVGIYLLTTWRAPSPPATPPPESSHAA